MDDAGCCNQVPTQCVLCKLAVEAPRLAGVNEEFALVFIILHHREGSRSPLFQPTFCCEARLETAKMSRCYSQWLLMLLLQPRIRLQTPFMVRRMLLYYCLLGSKRITHFGYQFEAKAASCSFGRRRLGLMESQEQ